MNPNQICLDREKLPYRPCVGIVLLNQRGLVFVGRRIDTAADAWQMPQGGIDAGETPEDAALRELEEEIGTRQVELLRQAQEWLYYDLPDELLGKVWDGRYRGQKQLWFAAQFLGRDADIRIDTPHAEFSAWKWVELHRLPELAIPFKRDVYINVVNQFTALTQSIAER